jgi:uncharacterized membrane protein YqiK
VTIIVLAKLAFIAWLCLRFMPNNSVGVVEKLWSSKGSVPEGHILALNGEAGFQADLLRGGVHFGLWRWQYRVHTMPLVTIPQGKVGYVYARDGQSLPPSQTLGRVVECNNFQDARTFLTPGQAGSLSRRERKLQDKQGCLSHEGQSGQRGRQLAILRGVCH